MFQFNLKDDPHPPFRDLLYAPGFLLSGELYLNKSMILYHLFVPGRDLGVEGYTKDTLVTKLVELLAPEGPGHPNEVLTSDDEARSSPVKENHDDALQMARYFWWVHLTGSLSYIHHMSVPK